MDGFDRNLNRAAYASGAAPAAVFWHVTRPLILPGILTGAVFAFVTAFDEIVCVIFLGGPEFRTLPRQIWSGVKETVSPTITVAAVLLIIAAMSLALCVELLRRRAQRLRGQSVDAAGSYADVRTISMTIDTTALVRFNAVSKSYDGVHSVVRNLDLEVRAGEFLSLLGPSGWVRPLY